jgi:catechol 2,3-dioxygenase-like lactoylglutathione lyase family enzyme
MMHYGFHHLHLVSSDLEQSKTFFVNALGAVDKGAKSFGGATGRKLDLDGVRVYLRELKPGEQRQPGDSDPRFGYDHVGLAVPDVKAACTELEHHGAVVTVAPLQSPSGWLAFLRGPDGIIIELYDPIEDD